MSPSVREKYVEFCDTSNLKTALYNTLAYRAFSLTWASIYANLLEQKKVFTYEKSSSPQDWFGTPTWPPFHCFGTLIWQP